MKVLFKAPSQYLEGSSSGLLRNLLENRYWEEDSNQRLEVGYVFDLDEPAVIFLVQRWLF